MFQSSTALPHHTEKTIAMEFSCEFFRRFVFDCHLLSASSHFRKRLIKLEFVANVAPQRVKVSQFSAKNSPAGAFQSHLQNIYGCNVPSSSFFNVQFDYTTTGDHFRYFSSYCRHRGECGESNLLFLALNMA